MDRVAYSQYMVMVDPKKNHNKFYIVEVLDQDGGFVVRTKWGRVGAVGQKSDSPSYSSVEAAKSAARTVVSNKRRKGYNVVEMVADEYVQDGKIQTDGSLIVVSGVGMLTSKEVRAAIAAAQDLLASTRNNRNSTQLDKYGLIKLLEILTVKTPNIGEYMKTITVDTIETWLNSLNESLPQVELIESWES